MKVALLDVNVLIALLWPTHEHHEAAHSWFVSRGRAGWATCPLTQLGFVRIVSNPAFSSDALSPRSALMLLKRNLQHPRHEFWADDVPVAEALAWTEQHLQGHRQLTDGYLLDLAHRRKGRLASFDTGTQELAASERGSLVELVPTDEESA